MGGHVAEKLFIGSGKISSGCGSDMTNATQLAKNAVRNSGMFGAEASYVSSNFQESSEEYNSKIDRIVKQILDVSNLNFLVTCALNDQMLTTLFFCRNHLSEYLNCCRQKIKK